MSSTKEIPNEIMVYTNCRNIPFLNSLKVFKHCWMYEHQSEKTEINEWGKIVFGNQWPGKETMVVRFLILTEGNEKDVDWISVTEELPPEGEFIEVKSSGGGIAKVRISGTSEPYIWIFKSGLRFRVLEVCDLSLDARKPRPSGLG